MVKRVPKEWVKTTLGNVCAINPRSPQAESLPDDAQISFVPMAAVEEESGRLDPQQLRDLGEVRRGYTHFEDNDVIFAKITPCMENGKIALAAGLKNGVGFGSTEFVVLRPYEGVLPRFLLYFLLQKTFRKDAERQMTGASGQKRVPSNYLVQHEFLLPPTREQERIVSKLDAALMKLERAEQKTAQAKERLEQYRAAVLQDAVLGELTREWREQRDWPEGGEELLVRLRAQRHERWEQSERSALESRGKWPKNEKWKQRYKVPGGPATNGLPAIPKQWAWASMDELAWSAGYGTSVKCSYDAGGPPVLRIPNIRNGVIDRGDLKFAATDSVFRPQDFVAVGDMLIVRTNGSKRLIGRAALAGGKPDRKYGFASYLIRFRLVGADALWNWISLAWDSDLIRREIESRAKTTAGQYNVSLSGLADLAIPLPPEEEQIALTREVGRRLAAAARLHNTLKQQSEKTRATRDSLLIKAFTGTLVTQQAGDDPATNLLARFEEARRTGAKKTKGKRMPRPKLRRIRRPLLEVMREHGKPITPEQLFRDAGFQATEADLFYRELVSLQKLIVEKKPALSDARTWPSGARVLLELKGKKV
jgi:type I restriction enzyme S subunit